MNSDQMNRRLEEKVSIEITHDGILSISNALRALLADVFTLYVKIKSFHWHISGPRFYELHKLLDEQAEQIFGMVDDVAERARKIGGTTLRSVNDITRH